ncbi:hypothetical protein T4D_8790 [Trichinella pseudospiralis]|uniref:Uncharacterized protein n=1 Tax=Trichinella pseudospiralis TaxID=6337 RepID=A0A0V1FB02_TRIPS|nr:hypothetical protein T4D_8790 [Trichinella pseudospiralis]
MDDDHDDKIADIPTFYTVCKEKKKNKINRETVVAPKVACCFACLECLFYRLLAVSKTDDNKISL